MTNRKDERYSIDEFFKTREGLHAFKVRFQLGDRQVTGTIKDISISGLGFEIINPDKDIIDIIESADHMIAEIFIAKVNIITKARKIWCAALTQDSIRVLKGGLEFIVISDSDRLKIRGLFT